MKAEQLMRKNFVKDKLKQGEPALGAWLNLPGITPARAMSRLGFDWLLIDMEHSAYDPVVMADMVAIIADAGTSAPLVRVPSSHNVEWFKWALDAGAWGILAPMINTRQEAELVVSWSKYPPIGTRSIGGAFAQYGFGTTDRASYTNGANDEILVMVQIESRDGLNNVEEILSVPGIDVAFVGPNDLHAQLGFPPSYDGTEPEFVAALERIQAAAKKNHLAAGIMTGDGASAAKRVQQGFQLVTVTTDLNSMIAGATRQLHQAQREGRQD
jgi:4-hydroxy-2-oxoheptanedioate aldolase